MLDDRQRTRSSQIDGLPVWSRESNAFGWRSYLGERVRSASVSELAAPARAMTLGGFPPTCIIVGGIDGFCDENIDFAQRLMQSGVPTELHVYPGAPHGFDQVFATAAVTRRASRDVQDWLRRAVIT
jgi:acetyl esterase/lipase